MLAGSESSLAAMHDLELRVVAILVHRCAEAAWQFQLGMRSN